MNELEYEQEHVHQVYNQIASHFSSTRFKPWPVVDKFLRSLQPGAVGLDVGCGNGKYLSVRKDVFIVASDRSSELLKFAAEHQPHDAVGADTLSLPHPNTRFDFAICIAVIHHLSTPERRRDAIRAILHTLRRGSTSSPPSAASASSSSSVPSSNPVSTPTKDQHNPKRRESRRPRSSSTGQGLVFVWALEQKSSRRGWDKGMDQDVLVPWVLKTEHDRSKPVEAGTGASGTKPTTMTTSTTTTTADSKTDTNNHDGGQSDGTSTTQQHPPSDTKADTRTFQRYYHLYREGELETDIVAAGGRVVEKGYDRDNWWAIFEPV